MNGENRYATVNGGIDIRTYLNQTPLIETTPVTVTFYSESYNEDTFKREDIVEYNIDHIVSSKDNKG